MLLRVLFVLFVLTSLILLAGPLKAQQDASPTWDVWPAKAPGETGEASVGRVLPAEEGKKQVQRITDVTKPTMTIYKPTAAQNTGAAVLVCPGGGYHILAINLEGEEVAQWLNSIGITAAVLKYRVPRREDQPKHLAPLQDAQRALSLLRSKASELKIDPQRIGILGFSAGGHLSSATSTNFDQRQYYAIDAIDKVSCRPDFTVLVYPAYLYEDDRLASEIRVSSQTPPAFLVHAGDDPFGPENSIAYYRALHEAEVPASLHIFPSGGHGFGLRPSENPVSQWPKLCEQWFEAQGLLRPSRG